MGYTALYREWRPQNFYDIVGQEHITTTVKNQILNDRINESENILQESKITELESKNKHFKNKIKDLESENRYLKNKINELENDNETYNNIRNPYQIDAS